MQEFIIEDKVKFLVEVVEGGKYRVRPYISTPSGRWLEQPVQIFNSLTEWLACFKEAHEAYTPKKQQ